MQAVLFPLAFKGGISAITQTSLDLVNDTLVFERFMGGASKVMRRFPCSSVAHKTRPDVRTIAPLGSPLRDSPLGGTNNYNTQNKQRTTQTARKRNHKTLHWGALRILTLHRSDLLRSFFKLAQTQTSKHTKQSTTSLFKLAL